MKFPKFNRWFVKQVDANKLETSQIRRHLQTWKSWHRTLDGIVMMALWWFVFAKHEREHFYLDLIIGVIVGTACVLVSNVNRAVNRWTEILRERLEKERALDIEVLRAAYAVRWAMNFGDGPYDQMILKSEYVGLIEAVKRLPKEADPGCLG